MDGLQPLSENDGVADLYIEGVPMRITHALTYVRLKHLHGWFRLTGQPNPIELHSWEEWEDLEDRLSARWGRFLWHPANWQTYYETLPEIPASAPDAVPSTMAEVRARRKGQAEEQYALFDA